MKASSSMITFLFRKHTYYMNMSVLPKNTQLVFSKRNYIRDTSETFTCEDIAVFPLFFL